MTRVQAIKRRVLGAAVIVGMAVALGACHGHDDDDDNTQAPPVATTPTTPTTPANPAPPATVTDAFIAMVLQMVGMQDETSEPVAIDSVTVTTPEDTEPQPVAGS